MVRRLLRCGLHGSQSITALDPDAALLDIAASRIAGELAGRGYRVLRHGRGIAGEGVDHRIVVHLPCATVIEFHPEGAGRFDLITAHALMDVLPLEAVLSRFSGWLAPGGLLYATLVYDGDTALFPAYRDQAFEATLLAAYDASMERRRVQSESTGGAHAGRRVLGALWRSGFERVAYGSSDWNITPLDGRYRGRDGDVLRALLGFIHNECAREASINGPRLACWYTERCAEIERAELGMIVHQLDILAMRRRA
jgi:hypothetical protein